MSKQLESILQRAPRATVRDEIAPQPRVTVVAQVQPTQEQGTSPAKAERDVSLGVEVPESVKRAINIKAATEGVTNRALLLQALQGIGITVPEGEVRDRRK
jgi:hypothetical protein